MKWFAILTLAILTGCASTPKFSENPADCAYETGRFEEGFGKDIVTGVAKVWTCLLYTSPSPRDGLLSRMPSSA